MSDPKARANGTRGANEKYHAGLNQRMVKRPNARIMPRAKDYCKDDLSRMSGRIPAIASLLHQD